MADLSMYETGNGGSWENAVNDLFLANSLWSQPYLALFGGNYEQSTPPVDQVLERPTERADWWGNSIAFPDDPIQQFNSETERTLDNIVLNQEGLQEVVKAVLHDLAYLTDIAETETNVTLVGVEKIKIAIRLIQPDTLESINFVFLWDGTRLEQIITPSQLTPVP
jgi:hypothetical protein